VSHEADWIAHHHDVWQRKESLRLYYEQEIFARIDSRLRTGRTLELGAGPGFYAANRTDIVSVDVSSGPATKVVADAHHLPFADASFANVVGIDTLHHLAKPGQVLSECARVLAPGGRIVLAEPWTGPIGWLVYRYAHHEECESVPDPWLWASAEGKDPMIGNAVIPKAVLADDADRLKHHVPDLAVDEIMPFGALSFLITGGFQKWGLPWSSVRLACKLEAALPSPIMRWSALRALFVVSKRS
jgi:SAM-dependent methyltransferase